MSRRLPSPAAAVLRGLSTLLAVAAAIAVSSWLAPPVRADPLAPVDSSGVALVREHLAARDLEGAEIAARELLDHSEAEHGRRSLAVAESIYYVVAIFQEQGRFGDEEAFALIEEGVSIRAELFEPDAPEQIRGLRSLAIALSYRGDYSGSVEQWKRIVDLTELSRGPDDRRVADRLNDLAEPLNLSGRKREAVSCLERAAEIARATDPPHPRTLMRTLYNLAVTYRDLGDYERAEALYGEAIEFGATVWGETSVNHARLVLAQAQMRTMLGRDAEALRVIQQTQAILEEREGELGHNELLITALSTEIDLRLRIGDGAGAKAVAERYLETCEAAYGEDSTRLVHAVRVVAETYAELGEWDAARTQLARGLALAEAQGEDGRFARAEVGLARGQLELAAGDPARATRMLSDVRDFYRAERGPDHQQVAAAEWYLALAQLEAGDGAGALVSADDAIRITRGLSPDDPHLGDLRTLKAVALVYLDDRVAARAEALAALDILCGATRSDARHLTEAEAFALRASHGDTDLLVWLTAESEPDERGIEEAWDAVIRDRAVLLDEMVWRTRLARDLGDPALARLAAEVRVCRANLSHLAVRGPGDDPEVYAAQRTDLQRQLGEAEGELASRSASFRTRSSEEAAGFTEIAAAVAPGEALVGYVRYSAQRPSVDSTPPPRTFHPAGNRVAPAYAAFVRWAGRTKLLPLGDAAAVDAEVEAWRTAMLESDEAAARRAGEVLRRRVWDPVAGSVDDASAVFLVPDGALHLVSFAALPSAEVGAYLVETAPLLHVLSTERDLAVPPVGPAGSGLLALGGIDYDAGELQLVLTERETGPVSPLRHARPDCASFTDHRFAPLPASSREVDLISKLWESTEGSDATVLRGTAAAESALESAAVGRRVLHLATHGYFLSEGCIAGRHGERGVMGTTSLAAAAGAASGRAQMPGPGSLLLGGLALAGANQRGGAGSGQDDGILTALEIGALDLGGVEWVVLSACDTGLGEIVAGEGVLGLRRAFRVAGAHTLVTSLWPVRDEDALAWMRTLYDVRLAEGKTTRESVSEASRRRIAELRQKGETTHPRHWGAFVATGAWE